MKNGECNIRNNNGGIEIMGIIERVYYLNGEETDLGAILEYLEDMLCFNGNTEMWEDFGIDFEDKEVE